MKRPMEQGAPIDAKRYARWLAQFAGYRNPVTNGLIELWLEQFKPNDEDLAARVLDAVLFITTQHIHTRFRETLGGLEGWHMAKSKRHGRWFFVPFSGSTGESGDSMVHAFRMATSMNKKAFDDLFIHRSELVSAKLGPDDTVVLLDDFSGTGNQACESWKLFEELLTGGPKVVLLLVAATAGALKRISNETDMEAVCGTNLRSKDNIFHADCPHFSAKEKASLLSFCNQADSKNPKGWGETGLLVVLSHQCPNNSIPILHATHPKWSGLFPRHN
jgi:hypothetical protein